MRIEIKLKKEDDRVIELQVTTHSGETYLVDLEFMDQHDYGDTVQSNVWKYDPINNRIKNVVKMSHRGKIINSGEDCATAGGVWYDFV